MKFPYDVQKVSKYGSKDSTNITKLFTLKTGSSVWQSGGEIPSHHSGCGASISDTKLALIGGTDYKQDILKYNIKTNQWTQMGQPLLEGRSHHACAKIENAILVSGGLNPEGKVSRQNEGDCKKTLKELKNAISLQKYSLIWIKRSESRGWKIVWEPHSCLWRSRLQERQPWQRPLNLT